jgi:hypothetical protein
MMMRVCSEEDGRRGASGFVTLHAMFVQTGIGLALVWNARYPCLEEVWSVPRDDARRDFA